MPSGKSWLLFTLINIGFSTQILALYYFTKLQMIRENWSEYRCNPIYMPFSNDIESDFTYCIQNIQTNYIGYLLEPITYLISNMSIIGSGMMGDIQMVREMFNKIRYFLTNIISSIFGVFLNIIIEFQKITISIKDLVGKIVGTMVTFLYILDGSMKTTQSMWNGPPGQMVKALGHCFHPDTNIQLKNGTIVKMKDVNLGDILINGSKVTSIMKIKNTYNEELYQFIGRGVNNADIFVTGTHMIYNDIDEKYIYVKDHPNAVKQDIVRSDVFSCLITDNHLLYIGKELFWDWEDYIIKNFQNIP